MIYPVDDKSLFAAAECLKSGGLAAFPTETVYGLGGDAFNPAALAKIFEVKRRPYFDPLIIHIAGLEALERILDSGSLRPYMRKRLDVLSRRFWPGPLTLILPKRSELPDLATGGLPTAALRFPSHPAAQKLILLSTGAVAAPSANLFGCLSPTRAEHVEEQLGDKIGIILDGGPAGIGLESTVLDLAGELPRILRPGGTPQEAIEELIGRVEAGPAHPSGAEEGGPQISPGLLKSHYAPRTALSVHSLEELIALGCNSGEGCLFFDGSSRDTWRSACAAVRGRVPDDSARFITLSEKGDISEAAANFFEALHRLDRLGLTGIRAQKMPERGLGAALNDRLLRAAAGLPAAGG
jgi:L-threonylcarbamoyladenylate synthase